MYIPHVFTDSGSPKTGLSPTITIYDIALGQAVISNAGMTEIGATGIYYYDFTSYSATKHYVAKLDGTSTLATASERYVSKELTSKAEEYFRQRAWSRKLEKK